MNGTRKLRVENLTRQTTLIQCGKIADHFWSRLKGLMGVRQLVPGDGLLITRANQVHTHFMAIPIDVFYVDKTFQIIDMDRELPPWRIGRLRRGARYVVEAPSGTAAASGCTIGDTLSFTPY
jgi:uncharacterized membrane protein (UPF0127 family)